MKLVDILARELKEWPESWGIYCVSSKVEGSFAAWFGYRNPVFEGGGWSNVGTVELWLSEEPEDRKGVVVRRFEWQAAVDALKFDSAPAWVGVGLPPVDLPCMWHSDGQTGWQEVVVLAYSGESAWIQPKGKPSIIVGNPANFRPIRTPEQIAAEERDKAAEALYLTINWNDTASTWANLSRGRREDYFKAIDAGYRKFEIVDN